uniref:Uncharacterized protein n=1 Tax=Lotharella globosa TaxID=91324 RepID=A0A7S3Z3Z8_9EUKA
METNFDAQDIDMDMLRNLQKPMRSEGGEEDTLNPEAMTLKSFLGGIEVALDTRARRLKAGLSVDKDPFLSMLEDTNTTYQKKFEMAIKNFRGRYFVDEPVEDMWRESRLYFEERVTELLGEKNIRNRTFALELTNEMRDTFLLIKLTPDNFWAQSLDWLGLRIRDYLIGQGLIKEEDQDLLDAEEEANDLELKRMLNNTPVLYPEKRIGKRQKEPKRIHEKDRFGTDSGFTRRHPREEIAPADSDDPTLRVMAARRAFREKRKNVTELARDTSSDMENANKTIDPVDTTETDHRQKLMNELDWDRPYPGGTGDTSRVPMMGRKALHEAKQTIAHRKAEERKARARERWRRHNVVSRKGRR